LRLLPVVLHRVLVGTQENVSNLVKEREPKLVVAEVAIAQQKHDLFRRKKAGSPSRTTTLHGAENHDRDATGLAKRPQLG